MLCRSVKDLELLSKVAFGLPGRSHDVAPLPFRDITLPSKLRFGYYTHGVSLHSLKTVRFVYLPDT